MIAWPAKDPAEVEDFTWQPPLDSGDTIASFTATVASGTIVKDSATNTTTAVTVWISGGTDGENATVELSATTAGGRTFRETAVLPVIDRAGAMLALFRLRYPAFSTVPDGTIGYWLADSVNFVGEGWGAADLDPAKLALAAHRMAEAGVLNGGQSLAGVTAFRSGSFSAQISDTAANRTGLSATIYGREYLALRGRNFAGPILAWDPPTSCDV